MITKSLFSNPVEAEDAFNARVDQSDLLLAAVPYSSIVDSTIVIKESDLKEAYDKKKEQFRQYVETRNIKYIDVQVTASPEDKADIQKEVEEYTAQLGRNFFRLCKLHPFNRFYPAVYRPVLYRQSIAG